MRRPPILTPAWFALVLVITAVGGVLAEWIDVSVFESGDETFQWSDVAMFAVVMLLINVGPALWSRRRQRAQGLG